MIEGGVKRRHVWCRLFDAQFVVALFPGAQARDYCLSARCSAFALLLSSVRFVVEKSLTCSKRLIRDYEFAVTTRTRGLHLQPGF